MDTFMLVYDRLWSSILMHMETFEVTVQTDVESITENFKNIGATVSSNTTQKMKFSIKDFSRKYDQIRSFLRIWSHLLEKSLMENFIFCAV